MARQYPPPAEDVLEAFRRWLSVERGREHRVKDQPDASERNEPEVDYVLEADASVPEVAAEVSSIWYSEQAGEENAYLVRWSEEVRATVKGQIAGEYRVCVQVPIGSGVTPGSFAKGLISLTQRRYTELGELRRHAKGLKEKVVGMDIFLVQAREAGSDVSFGRFEPNLTEFRAQVSRIVSQRGTKFKHHKALGRETWLVVYNTVWVLVDDHEVQAAFEKALRTDYPFIDHVVVVEGSPPDDAWVVQVR